MSDLELFRNAPVDRAVFAPLTRWEGYMLLSKLQRMVFAAHNSMMALSLNDKAAVLEGIEQFKALSGDMQEMMEVLVSDFGSED